MKHFILLLIGINLALLATRPASAQPANDNFANRTVLTGVQVSVGGTTVSATREANEPAPYSNPGPSVWYEWTPAFSTTANVSITGSYREVIGVYTGTAVNALTYVTAASAGTGGTSTSLNFSPTAGTAYKILVSGRQTRSGTFTLSITQSVPMSISITAPTNGATLTAGSNTTVSATASSGAGTVTQVVFYANGAGIGVDTNSPFSITWTNAALGSNGLTAAMKDSTGLSLTSSVVSVWVVTPGVTITSPTNGAWQYGTMPVLVETTNAYPRGQATVSKVEFFANYAKIGESTTSPYDATWTNVTVGTNFFYAIMTDSASLNYTSAPSYFYVLGHTLVPTGAIWKYLDNGTDQGTAWTAPGFDDSTWASGPAQLGYGDGDEATVVGYGTNANNRYITTYFRNDFVLTNAASYTNWIVRVLRDDGAVLYVNGTEAARFNMPTGAVTYTTLTANAADDGTIFYPATLSPSLFVEGTNVLAVEIHQTTATSTDISFDLELVGQKDAAFNLPPTVSIVSPTNGAALIGPANVALTVNATDSDGSIALVEYFSGTNLLGSASSTPFSFVWPNAALGSYTLSAVATDNHGAKATSAPVAVTFWAAPQSRWVAFNEQNKGTASAANTTPYTIPALGTNAGLMSNIVSGAALPVTLTVTNAPGYDVAYTMGAPLAGTPAYNVFNDYIDWNSGTFAANGIHVYRTNAIGYTFSGLDPNKAYKFTATSVRAGSGAVSGNEYSNRWTQAELIGAASWMPAHSPGVITSNEFRADLSGSQAAFNSGINTNGEIVQWQNIIPGPGSSFTVLCKNYRGAFPGGYGSNALYSFAFTALRLEEFGTAPLVSITAPTNGATFQEPVDVSVAATASGFGGVTNLSFFTNGSYFGGSGSSPLSMVWSNAPAGTNVLQALALDSQGGWGTSTVVTITVNAMASNVPPVLASVSPAADAAVENLLSVQVVFNEPVSGVDAGDLLANGVPATGLSGSGSNYTSTFATPTPEAVSFTWALTHGIADLGKPVLPFDGTASNAVWSYTLLTNTVAPFVLARNPPDGAIVSNTLASIQVTFTEPVSGVDASDLIINGVPAIGVSGTGTNYTFSFSPIVFGGVVVAWATNHGIADLGAPPLPFDGTATNATWSYTLPSNSVPPVVLSQTPLAGATLSNTLTSLQVIFSETVTGLNAGDLLVNGTPATNLSGNGASYTFSFPSPALGAVQITWTTNHGIADIGLPPLPFDANGAGATWNYNLIDTIAPTIAAKNPAAGATLTNLTAIQVTFSEPVSGVNASDMLINGSAATGLAGSGSNYAFYFPQPATGTVSVAWAGGHGITDLTSNAFNASGAGATWAYNVVEQRVTLVASNAWYYWRPGTNEASTPIDAWRYLNFDHSTWAYSQAPFYYDDDLPVTYYGNTLITGMRSNYWSFFTRSEFIITNKASYTNLVIRSRIDDGMVVWLNGTELERFNFTATSIAYNSAAGNATEPLVAYYSNVVNALVEGTNVFAVQMFNSTLTSSDLEMDLDLTAQFVDPSAQFPQVQAVSPPAGTVFTLSNLTVTFTKPVTNVDAADLLVNGAPATNVTGSGATYTFSFASPAFGTVAISWVTNHGIIDLSVTAKPFDALAPGNTWQYTSLNPNAPVIVTQNPLAAATVNQLTQIQVTFSKTVTNVDASDLLVNGVPAASLSGSGPNYTFTFAQPAYGNVAVTWAVNHGITDLDMPANAFEAGRAGSTWIYTLADQTPPAIAAQNPPAGTAVTNLTQIQVTFTERVSGVNAGDLLINGVPATGLSGSGSNYTFTFPQPNASVIAVTWAVAHGIADLATSPNAFDAYAAGSTWSYTTPDTVPPTVASVYPPAGSTVRALTSVQVTFTEPVTGVEASDLRINSALATGMSGSAAGPYAFTFAEPVTGAVEIAWVPAHGITDLATPPNPFAGGEWTYFLNPNAQFDQQIVINEIMFHPPTESTNDQWIELRNTGAYPVNLTAWQFSKGVNFIFPNVTLFGDSYLVVAASVTAFQAKYPGVSNVIGGWTGTLKKSGETVHLRNAVGDLIDSVTYATGGDWGTRLRGSGDERVLSMTRSGTTVTVICPGNHQAGDLVTISGADQTNYNGTFALVSSSFSGFTYTISGTPATPATGTIIRRQLTDYTRTGWAWSCRADGLGSSIELVNPALLHSSGQNWGASTNLNGTPGRANTVAATNSAPLILEAQHFPPVPTSTSPITFTARVIDERTNSPLTVRLYWRIDSATPPAFSVTNMYDDGGHNDGATGDGYYGFVLPAQTNNTVLEFYFEARDAEGNVRTWPAPAINTNGVALQGANALLQVDNSTYSGNQPIYRLIMRESERAELASYPPNGTYRASNAGMNGSFAGSDGTGLEFRYRAEFRNRGAGTRSATPMNYKITLPSDQPYHSVDNLNINSQYPHAQLLGYALAMKAGINTEQGRAVQIRVNAANLATTGLPSYGSYMQLEATDGTYAANHFPLDPAGNAYRCQSGGHSANLSSLGTSWTSYANVGYTKQSNVSDNDWTDLINLILALNTNTADNAVYAQAVRQVVNVEEWMRDIATFQLALSRETSLPATGAGDDYSFYRGVNDPRFILLAHDWDTILNQGDTTGATYYTNTIWRLVPAIVGTNANPGPNVLPLSRFMMHPDFVPIYYRELKELADTVFSPTELARTVDETLGDWIQTSVLDAIKIFGSNRTVAVLAQIPLSLNVSNSTLTASNSFLRSTTATIALFGNANAIDTRSVKVNGQAATWSAWNARWTNTAVTLQPGVNSVLVQAFGTNSQEIARTNLLVWYDNGTGQAVSGALSGSPVWTPASGPYHVTANVTAGSGVTLTIQPGTTVFFDVGTTLTVSGSGRLLATGTDIAHIHLTRTPGAANWGSLDFIGATNESRLAYIDIDSCAGTTIGGHAAEIHVNGGSKVFFDHVVFANTPAQEYISFDGSSFIVQNSVFPTYPYATSAPEMLHGVNGIPAGGYGIFRDNYFGHTYGFNDTIDFTGGNRPSPILQIIGNVFDGACDDHLDLDSTDAWIEGNIFLHAHRDTNSTADPLDTSSAISGGVDFAGQYSEWTIINNLFYDVDHACLNKGGGRFIFANNTLVRVNKGNGAGLDSDISAFDFTDDNVALPDPTVGAGAYVAGNIIWDCGRLVANYNSTNHNVLFENNLLSLAWDGPGADNVVGDPKLNLSLITNALTADWKTVKAALTPQSGSPALGTGIGVFDKGGLNPKGLLVFGEPPAVTASTSATLTVAPGGTFNWGSVVPPYLWGYTHYQWKLDTGAWSAETPITTSPTITLSNLANGPHTVYVRGKNDAGYYQDDTFVYPTNASVAAHLTASRIWTVNATRPIVVLNELLADNAGAVVHVESTPDAVELHNVSDVAADLSGLRLTDDALNPSKYIFPLGTVIAPHDYLVAFANNPDGTPGLHLGFRLSKTGGSLYLYDSVANGGLLLDAVTYGLQLANLSIGRLADGTWALTQPTFGDDNVAAATGDPLKLKINEWLASEITAAPADFVEIFNPEAQPVALGGLYLTDNAAGWPTQHCITPLSFIAADGYTVFQADGNVTAGADHLNFSLASERGELALFDSDLTLIDEVLYGPQFTDIAQGRSPNGTTTFSFLSPPTPGSGNPGLTGGGTNIVTTTLNLLTWNSSWRYEPSGTDLGTAWLANSYDDDPWFTGQGMFYGTNPAASFPVPINTLLTFTTPTEQSTFYFRTHFTVNTNTAGYSLVASHYIDDGAVLYLNGQECYRYNMPAGTISYTSLATASISGNATLQGPITLPITNLLQGDNVLAVEVHQSALTSSDITLALTLDLSKSVTNITGAALVLNEIMANNQSVTNSDGTLTDWIELYNPGVQAADLSDCSLTDDTLTPRRWVFPAGATLPSQGFLVVRCDSSAPASTNNGPILNAGFGLKATGGGVYVYSSVANGGALAASVVYGLQAENFTLGRVPNGIGSWTLTLPTPASVNLAATLGNPTTLKINEWLAAPGGNADDWFEVWNPNAQPVAVGGLHVTDDLNNRTKYTIPALSFIGASTNGYQVFRADKNITAGADHVNFKLPAAGGAIGLATADGTLIDGVTYTAQETAVSEGRFPDGSAIIVRFPSTVSPGESNYRLLTNVIVNEVLAHSLLPLEDAIELRNLSAVPVDIGGWWLSDAAKTLRKYRIPDGTTLAANGYAVFYAYEFDSDPINNPLSFGLSASKGDDVYLSTGDNAGNLTGWRNSVKFGASENGVAFGRYISSEGDDHFVAMAARTFGADDPGTVEQFRTGTGLPNAAPQVGPIVITEIMYHPPDLGTNDNTRDEFIELHNTSSAPVPLYDPAYPTNTWRFRDAVDYNFPMGVILPAGSYVLVVSFDPATDLATLATFRATYSLGTNVALYGPYTGKLANSTAKVELYKPDAPLLPPDPDAGFVPYVLVERVKYADTAPWPMLADGLGYSLQRISMNSFGNDPTNWLAAVPTPAPLTDADTDGDGMPDAWETAHGFNPNDPSDANLDSDHDGLTNLQEYLAGTDPHNAASTLKLEVANPGLAAGTNAVLVFEGVAGKTYTVLYVDMLPAGWTPLVHIEALPASGPVWVTNAVPSGVVQRFYRIVTPRQ